MRSHYKEGSATDLCQQLLTMTQNQNRDPVNFVIRAMDYKQNILFACREETATDLKYSPGLLNELFRRSVETELADDNIRMQLRSLLQDANIDDETSINEMQVAALADTERKKKFALSTKVKSVYEISLAEKPSTRSTPKIDDTSEKILAAFEQMRCEVAAIKTELEEVKRSQREGIKPKGIQRPRCTTCKEAGNEKRDHFSICGSSDHFLEAVKRDSRELQGANETERPFASKVEMSHDKSCNNSYLLEKHNSFMLCKSCKTVRYCSRQCQEAQWSEHKAICSAISELPKKFAKEEKGLGDSKDANIFASHISPQIHAKILKHVGKKCTVNCFIYGIKLEALWDTGSPSFSIAFINCKKMFSSGCCEGNF